MKKTDTSFHQMSFNEDVVAATKNTAVNVSVNILSLCPQNMRADWRSRQGSWRVGKTGGEVRVGRGQAVLRGGLPREQKAHNKGVYPQSDRSLVVVDIDASKGFVDQ